MATDRAGLRSRCSFVCVALTLMSTAACQEAPHSCGEVGFTFAPISGTSPDVGTAWKAAAVVASEDAARSPATELLTAESAQAQLQIYVPTPLAVGQTVDATFVDGMDGLHNVYYWVNGATQGSWYSTGGSLRVDSLDPIQVTMSNVTMDVYPFYPSTTGSFVVNGSGQWSAAPLPCSIVQP